MIDKVKEFAYTKANGDISDRIVYALTMPSDKLFGLDLTEFDPEERDEYIAQLRLLDEDIKDAIKEMGLASQYRFFKEDGIDYGS